MAHVSAIKKMAEREVDSCVRGYHVYESIWVASLGEQIVCIREPLNSRDRSAVALNKNGVVIGHLPQKYSKFVHRLLEEEELLSALSQAQEDIQQIYLRVGLRYHASYYSVVRGRKLIKLNFYVQRNSGGPSLTKSINISKFRNFAH